MSRGLVRVQLVDCKLHGAHGTQCLDGVEIRHPDLSPAGDRTAVGTADDVVRGWRTLS